MKTRLPAPPVTEQTMKNIKINARMQCVEQLGQYEMELDSVTLWVLHTQFGFGKKRLEKFYELMFESRRKMADEFATTDDSLMAEYAMRWQLKEKGIDVEEMYSRQKSRFKAKVR